MDVAVDLAAPYPPERVYPWVADLGRYPGWLDIVQRARPDGSDRWIIDLRARLGPLARSKRLRMARTVEEPGRRVRFEREETDGRDHSAWVLQGVLTPEPNGCRLAMSLHYDGGRLAPVLERLLSDEIERSRSRLLSLIASDEATSSEG